MRNILKTNSLLHRIGLTKNCKKQTFKRNVMVIRRRGLPRETLRRTLTRENKTAGVHSLDEIKKLSQRKSHGQKAMAI